MGRVIAIDVAPIQNALSRILTDSERERVKAITIKTVAPSCPGDGIISTNSVFSGCSFFHDKPHLTCRRSFYPPECQECVFKPDQNLMRGNLSVQQFIDKCRL